MDVVVLELPSLLGGETRGPVTQQHELARPRRERARHLEAALPAPVHREFAVAHLPAIAIRALEDAAPEHRIDARDAWDHVEQPGRDEQLARAHAPAWRQRDDEPGALARRAE